MGDHKVGLHRCVRQEWYTPAGSAVVTCLHAAARTRRAARAVQGEVLSVWQVLQGTPSAPRISAQRVARFDHHCTSNLFINNKLRQIYSRCRPDALQQWRAFQAGRRDKAGPFLFSLPACMKARDRPGLHCYLCQYRLGPLVMIDEVDVQKFSFPISNAYVTISHDRSAGVHGPPRPQSLPAMV
jgi:hypothetical protein